MVNLWDRTPEQRIECAKENKELGSEKFKLQDYKSAGQYYISALRDIIPIIESSDEIQTIVRSLKIACYTNLSACQLKLKQYDRVILNCEKSLSLDGDNVKSLFRRASAYLECHNCDDAEKDIHAILRLEPNNSAVKQLETRLKKLLAEKDKIHAKMMKAFLTQK